jgi:hypothetical protein
MLCTPIAIAHTFRKVIYKVAIGALPAMLDEQLLPLSHDAGSSLVKWRENLQGPIICIRISRDNLQSGN